LRITLAGSIHADIAEQLSVALNYPLIEPKSVSSPATGLPSDDLTILALIEDIHGNRGNVDGKDDFLISNYPQNVIQAQSLDLALARIGQPVSLALMMESTKKPQNRENRALIRYYRTQNKLILFDEADSISELCSRIHLIYEKRRSSDNQTNKGRA